MTLNTQYQQSRTRDLPYASLELESGRILVTGYFGGWTIMTRDEFESFGSTPGNDNSRSPDLRKRLSDAGITLTDANPDDIAARFLRLNANLLQKPSLHIVNLTSRCNHRCKYCHAGVSRGESMMSPETAREAAKFIMDRGEESIQIEFQGGESLLNFSALKEAVETARHIHEIRPKQEIGMSIVTNMSLLDEEKLEYLIRNGINICTSLDGPAHVHDANRRDANGGATHSQTISKILWARKMIAAAGKDQKISALCTVTRASLAHAREIVDHYLETGMESIHLRPINRMGDAFSSWAEIGCSPEEFNTFWTEAMERILELNKSGRRIVERGAYFMLMKLIAGKDPAYTEMMSPCGAGRGQILYNTDGSIYTCDDGRMIPENIFRVGHIDEPGEDALSCDDLISMWASSTLDLSCYHCAFRPWCGTCPVANYASSGNIAASIMESSLHKVYHHQFSYLFNKLDSDAQATEIFKKWLDEGMQ